MKQREWWWTWLEKWHIHMKNDEFNRTDYLLKLIFIRAISCNTHQLHFIKLHRFKLETF